MKRFFNTLKWVFLTGMLLALILLAGFVYYMETAIDRVMDNDRQMQLFNLIESSPALPDNFYRTYEKYYPDKFKDGIWITLIKRILFNRRKKDCPCLDVYIHSGLTGRLKNNSWLNSYIIHLEIEDRFSAKKCFEFDMHISEFGYNQDGIQEASRFYYQKELNELNEREILSLNLIQKYPTRFNPIYHRKELDEAVDRILKKRTAAN